MGSVTVYRKYLDDKFVAAKALCNQLEASIAQARAALVPLPPVGAAFPKAEFTASDFAYCGPAFHLIGALTALNRDTALIGQARLEEELQRMVQAGVAVYVDGMAGKGSTIALAQPAIKEIVDSVTAAFKAANPSYGRSVEKIEATTDVRESEDKHLRSIGIEDGWGVMEQLAQLCPALVASRAHVREDKRQRVCTPVDADEDGVSLSAKRQRRTNDPDNSDGDDGEAVGAGAHM